LGPDVDIGALGRGRSIGAVNATLYTDPAVAALAQATPLLVDVVPARDVTAHHAAGGVSHAGPPIAPQRMCPPMRAALGVAMTIEGLAENPEEALALADAGEVPILPNHDVGGVGPMAGVVTGSMPLLIARDEASGKTAWCPLNEGSGKVLRYGADDGEVVARLEWMRDVLGPELSAALRAAGPIDLIALQTEALLRGDECHHATHVCTELTLAALGDHLSPAVREFIDSNHQFGLNVAMVAAKLALACADGHPGSPLLTVLARNGVEVGIKLSGTGDAWFVGPAAMPAPAALFDGYAPSDMNPDLGDSAIVEVYGLGGLAVAASPGAAEHVGLDPADAEAITERLRAIAIAEHPGMRLPTSTGELPAILGVDARAVVATGIRPPVHTGIAHVRPGVGQIGGGVTHPPMEAFQAAVAALDA
jgi:hypothetical protein